ncbi:MAG TPA: Gfo/Idh/MocA family oxidoreductase [Candidatus Dormibacteraeota bacterium]|nr:Gfo/Idh/MocA family oxidoreductase [Candidatus Dormibacteraeota bacterium]
MRPITEIGAAVVGTGFIGAVHVEALRRLGVQVHGVVGSSRERAAARSRELGLPPAYESFQAMLDDPRVEVVHITSPNHLHHAQATATLKAGKHVVCEKPLAMTGEQSAELVQLAAATGRVNAVNFNIRFYPVLQHVRGLVEGNALGEVRLVSGHYLQDWLLLDTDWNWRLEPELGGDLRTVADIGSHWMDLTSFLTGKRITSVMADLQTFIKTRRQPTGPVDTFATERSAQTVAREIHTEDCATILLRYEDGTMGSLTVSQVSPGRKNSLVFEIDGAESAVGWNSERPDELWIGHRGQPNEVVLRDPAILNARGRKASYLPGGHAEGFADTFKALYAAVYEAVAEGKPGDGYPTFADGHDEMLVCDAVARSARERRWVEVQRGAAVGSAAR